MRLSGIICLFVSLTFCSACGEKPAHAANSVGSTAGESAADEEAKNRAAADFAVRKESAMRMRAAVIAAALTDKQLAAQVMISGIDGRGSPGRDMKLLLEECPAGGIVLFRYNLDTPNEAIQNLIQECAALIVTGTVLSETNLPKVNLPDTNQTDISPFVAVDHEGGSVNRFLPGVAPLPAAFSYWQQAEAEGREAALARIEADAFRSGMRINSFGINLNLAPVAEYVTDENRDFLDDRSYGPEPAFVADAAAAFIRGMEQAGVLCAVKHFPGSAGADPHRFASVLRGNAETLANLTAPFAALTRQKAGGPRALMIAHTSVPAYDGGRIASLSPAVMGGWLRGELGFSGIIIADDFSMGAAISGSRLSSEAAAVRSLAAGADMVLVWPPDIRRTHRAIQSALASGDLPRERLREAAGRILYEKLRMGLVHGE